MLQGMLSKGNSGPATLALNLNKFETSRASFQLPEPSKNYLGGDSVEEKQDWEREGMSLVDFDFGISAYKRLSIPKRLPDKIPFPKTSGSRFPGPKIQAVLKPWLSHDALKRSTLLP